MQVLSLVLHLGLPFVPQGYLDSHDYADYMAPYLQMAGGEVYNPIDLTSCQYCQLTNSKIYLAGVSVYYGDRWRNFGLIWAYVAFNIFGALFFYWIVRVHSRSDLLQTPNWLIKSRSTFIGKKEKE